MFIIKVAFEERGGRATEERDRLKGRLVELIEEDFRRAELTGFEDVNVVIGVTCNLDHHRLRYDVYRAVMFLSTDIESGADIANFVTGVLDKGRSSLEPYENDYKHALGPFLPPSDA